MESFTEYLDEFLFQLLMGSYQVEKWNIIDHCCPLVSPRLVDNGELLLDCPQLWRCRVRLWVQRCPRLRSRSLQLSVLEESLGRNQSRDPASRSFTRPSSLPHSSTGLPHLM